MPRVLWNRGILHGESMRFLLCLVLLGIPTHSSSGQARAAGSAPCSIVAFGDSITWGAYATHNRLTDDPAAWNWTAVTPVSLHVAGKVDTSYPGDVARALHTSVCNYGVPGEMTLTGLPRWRALLRAFQPRTVAFMEGVNDLASDVPATTILDDLEAMVLSARQRGLTPVLVTLTPTYYPRSHPHHFLNARVHDINRSIRLLAARLHVALADTEAAFMADGHGAALTRHGRSLDYLHPNDAGYRLIADAVAGALHSPVGKRGLYPAISGRA